MSNKKGGYIVLDLGNRDLSTSQTISGIWDLFESADKPILVTGYIGAGVERKPFFVGSYRYVSGTPNTVEILVDIYVEPDLESGNLIESDYLIIGDDDSVKIEKRINGEAS